MTPRSARGRRIVLAVAVAVLVPAVLAGCSEAAKNNGQNSLEPKGPDATTIDNLFNPVAIVAILVGIFIIVATLYVAIKFRRRPGNENPKQIHGNTRLELGWTIVPALILAVIAVPSVAAIFDLAENPGPKALQVTVVGKQWWWEFQYPDAKVVTSGELVIPADRPVLLSLSACETKTNCNVIHSFWVPELAGKKDVVPGHDNTLTIEADKPGTYLGQCAEYCGLSHANMRFRVIAKTADDFDTWLTEQQQGPAQEVIIETTDADGKTTQEPAGPAQDLMVNTFGCAGCHALDDSSQASYGPNLTHLASRTTFASGTYKLNRTNLVNWILDAPSMIPMESQDCRLPPGEGICVGMPSFTKNTPKGMPTMTKAQAEEIADFLLGQT
ncbi:MAG: cytochrome c oxidase subunit II [Acidimicrobiia bacterium]